MHGNPYYRLLRSEVESFVIERFGEDYIKNRKQENELSKVNQEIRKLKRQLKETVQKLTHLFPYCFPAFFLKNSMILAVFRFF